MNTKDLQCIHRAGCPKPDVCREVGHCTSMTAEDLRMQKEALTSNQRYAWRFEPGVDDDHNYEPPSWHITDNGVGVAVCYSEQHYKGLVATLNRGAHETTTVPCSSAESEQIGIAIRTVSQNCEMTDIARRGDWLIRELRAKGFSIVRLEKETNSAHACGGWDGTSHCKLDPGHSGKCEFT